jgi:hypothetical protein
MSRADLIALRQSSGGFGAAFFHLGDDSNSSNFTMLVNRFSNNTVQITNSRDISKSGWARGDGNRLDGLVMALA